MVKVKDKFPHLADGNIDIVSWLDKIKGKYRLENIDLLQKTCVLASTASQGLTTFYGQPCLEQGLEMAEMILDLKLDQEAVAAAIIASTIQHTQLSIETLTKQLGDEVAKLIVGIQHMNTINQLQKNPEKNRNPIQIDRLRKMVLAMASDIRVVLIKLAERTCIMRGIKNINNIERKRIAQETMDIYAPLANRLGVGQIKWELEDLAFHYTDPTTYKMIAHFLAERRIDREQRIENTLHRLKEALTKANIQSQMTGRAKHIYSIYLKMQQKNLDYKNIYDYSAIRVLVPTLEECYNALSIVHRLWEHLPEEFDDYIAKPKANGYRSIHTAVIGPEGKNLEIQIRTHDMHEEAELGIAAHWIYKENNALQSGYESKITFLRQLLDWHKEVATQSDPTLSPSKQHIDDRIYVLTPTGDILELPAGATPLDFAYHIHSEIGHRCRGAKVNGHIVPLSYALHTGEYVEIMTTPHGTPSRDWLLNEQGYLKTARARAKVAHWFRQYDLTQEIETGKRHSERNESPRSTTPRHEVPHRPTSLPSHKQRTAVFGLQVDGISDLLVRIAKCCKPIPGDIVVGYITQGRGVSVHKKDCNNLLHLAVNDTHRIVQATWDSKHIGNYYVDLQIRAYGRTETLKEVTALLGNAKIELITLNSTLSRANNIIFINLTIQLHDLQQLKQLLNHIKQLPNVIEAKRISEQSNEK